MKAWVTTGYGAPQDVVSLVDRALPAVEPGQLRIRVGAAAVGLPDVMMCRGVYEYRPEHPFTGGQEVCGTVVEVGEDVTAKVGDRVMGVTSFFAGHGGFAEECMSMEGLMFEAPGEMTDAEAAAFGIAYQSAWIGLVTRGALKSADTLAVLGAGGGIGSAAVQLGRALGARVIAIASGEDKGATCRRLGADEFVDDKKGDFVAEVSRLTDGRGADVFFAPVGGDAFRRAIDCLGREARLLAMGFASGEWGQADTRALVMKNASAMGVFVGAYSADERKHVHEELVRLYRKGAIAPVVERVVDFGSLPQALADVESRKVAGKVVVRVGR
jgi:NADPH2:quinone reductase